MMRTSQKIESDATFVRLFGAGVLRLLAKESLWDRTQLIRSAPGGGKTSLFRIFTPQPLIHVYESRADPEFAELYSQLRDIRAIGDGGPQVLGILQSCARNYSTIEDLAVSPGQRHGLWLALLNSRILIGALRGALALRGLNYPGDLSRLSLERSVESVPALPTDLPSDGNALDTWAKELERKACDAIMSFRPQITEAPGHETLFALNLLHPDRLLCDGEPIVERIVVLLDDAHKLAPNQRRSLYDGLFDGRPPVSVWIAERLEVLSASELLSVGSTTNREYDHPLILEDYWRQSGRHKQFERIAVDIADRRVKSAREIQISSFGSCMRDSTDGSQWQAAYMKALDGVSTRVQRSYGEAPRYREWVRVAEQVEGTPRERAIAFRAVEINIARDQANIQLSLDVDLPLPAEELDETNRQVKSAAEFAVAQEFNIPYYFGMNRLASLASSNIEQFLDFSGEIFEEALANDVLNRQISLAPDSQERIIRQAVKRRWNEIPRRVANGRDVQRFLTAIGDLCKAEWSKGTASYGAGGVTGIGITMADREKLLKDQATNPSLAKVVEVLSACISHNLLEASLDRSQGQVGKTWMVIYLNRWLCAYFGLPLQYGGWRPQRLDGLGGWLEKGFVVANKGKRSA